MKKEIRGDQRYDERRMLKEKVKKMKGKSEWVEYRYKDTDKRNRHE